MFANVVLPVPVPPEIRMLSPRSTACFSFVAESSFRTPCATRSHIVSFRVVNFRIVISGRGFTTGGMSYRSWLDAVGTAIAVQQKLMRHSDISTTLNVYGDVVTDEMAQAHSKVVRRAIPRPS